MVGRLPLSDVAVRWPTLRLATTPNDTPNGALAVVSKDLTRCAVAHGIADSMLELVEHWDRVAPALMILAEQLECGACQRSRPFDSATTFAPFVRAPQWLDGSAFGSHGRLMTKAFQLDHDPASDGIPLMYQGLSDHFLGPTEDVPLPDEADGIDFEGEFAVVVDETPMGTTVEQAAERIKLVLQLNDWSLRALGHREMRSGFGFVQAKPACSMAPVAVTLDELGASWRRGQVALPLEVQLNGAVFGRPQGDHMSFSFPQLIAHAARTRRLSAGTIIGSGTISNDDANIVGSACIAERRALEMIEGGCARTSFMRFGDRVRMECRDAAGLPLFGAIDQAVIAAGAARPQAPRS